MGGRADSELSVGFPNTHCVNRAYVLATPIDLICID